MKLTSQDLAQMEKRYRAKLINSLSGFKSANLIGTRSKSGQSNLSIVSSVTHLGSDPALLLTVFRPDSVDRHTLEYIQETKIYTLNHINSSIFEAAHQTSARYERDQSEFEMVGLNEEYSGNFSAPFVKESHIKMAMDLKEVHKLEINGCVMIYGEIREIILPESSLQNDGFVDLEGAKTVCVSSLDSYHETKRLSRLSYAKPNLDLKHLNLKGEVVEAKSL